MGKIKLDFSDISMRGRMAFALTCLEYYMKKNDLDFKSWSIILDKLWNFTSIEYLDDWHQMASEYSPWSIIDCQFEMGKYLVKDDFDALQDLYATNVEMCQIIDLIIDLGVSQMYVKVYRNCQEADIAMTGIISVLETNDVTLPNVDDFQKFSFDEWAGWGKRFSRNDL